MIDRLEEEQIINIILDAKVKVLNDKERLLLYRHHDSGEAIKAIAADWGELPNTVSQMHRRALDKVSKYVENNRRINARN